MKEVKTVTKVYTLRNYGGASFECKWCGQTVKVDFIPGRGAVGSKRSILTVSDKFTQDAIENDPRFGRLITLDAVYGDKEEKKDVKAENAESTPKVRYSKKELEAMKLASQNEEPKEDVKKVSKKKETPKDEPKAEMVESVKSLNDAYDYFAEKGIMVESEEQLNDAKMQANVEFPNLK